MRLSTLQFSIVIKKDELHFTSQFDLMIMLFEVNAKAFLTL